MKDSYIIANDDNSAIMAMAFLVPDLTTRENRWMLTSIRTCTGIRRGQGWGTKLLELVCVEADANRVTLLLGVSPEGPGYFKRLVKWYARHGFLPLKRTVGPVNNVMVRKPR